MTKQQPFWLIILLTVATIFLFLSYIPNLYEASVVDIMPKDRVMLWGEHIYTYDYNVYLSKMRQGAEGRWSVVDKYDNNPQQKGVFLQMLYLMSGKIFGLLGISVPLAFHLLRTILSFFWILTIIYLNIFFLKKPKYYVPGVLLSLLAASFPVFYSYNNEWWVGYHMSWWTEMDVLKRISYIPHYTLNYIIVGILSVLLYKFQIPNSKIQTNINKQSSKQKKVWTLRNLKFGNYLEIENFTSTLLGILSLSKEKLEINANFLFICVLLFFSFFIHPASGILFIFSWSLYSVLMTTLVRPFKSCYILRTTIYTLILMAVILLPLLYFRSVTSEYPWKSLVDFDKYSRFPLNVKEYILALGPIFFTGVLGIIFVLIKKEVRLLSLVTWVLGAFVAIFVFKKLPFQSELRFVQTANHIPLAILSVYFLFTIKDFLLEMKAKIPISNDLGRAQRSEQAHWSKKYGIELSKIVINILIYGIIFSILTLGLVQSYFSIKAQTDFIHQRAVAGQPLVPYPPQVMYPLKNYWNAIVWLEKNTKNEDVLLSQVNAGNYIPAYAGNFVYVGHNPETPHYDERIAKVNQFFSGQMNELDAKEFLKKESISYIFNGPQEKEKAVEDIKKYSFLKAVYTSTFVTLYEVLTK